MRYKYFRESCLVTNCMPVFLWAAFDDSLEEIVLFIVVSDDLPNSHLRGKHNTLARGWSGDVS